MSGALILIVLLIAVVGIGVVAGLIAEGLRRKNFKDQVNGKKPIRAMDKDVKISYDKPSQEDPRITADREVLKTRSYQNLMEPK